MTFVASDILALVWVLLRVLTVPSLVLELCALDFRGDSGAMYVEGAFWLNTELC